MPLTTFESLEASLREAEAWAPRLKEASADQILTLIVHLDRAQHLVDTLTAGGSRFPAEEIQRIETVESFLRRDLSMAARKLREAGIALEDEAAEHAHLPDAWWWHVQTLAQEKRRQARRRLLTLGAVVGVIVGVLFVLYKTVLAPDPVAVARMNALDDARRAWLRDGDMQAALDAVSHGLEEIEAIHATRGTEMAPEYELRAWRAVLLDEMGDPEAARALFAESNAWEAYYYRASIYNYLGRFDESLADAQRVIEMAPDHPVGHLLLGDAYAGMGELLDADAAYETASELAFDDPAMANLYVTARQRRAALRQSPQW